MVAVRRHLPGQTHASHHENVTNMKGHTKHKNGARGMKTGHGSTKHAMKFHKNSKSLSET